MGIESGDEVRLAYVGRLSDGAVFDASVPEVVDGDAIPDEPSPPLSVAVGAERVVRGPGQIVEHIEEHLYGREEGDELLYDPRTDRGLGDLGDLCVDCGRGAHDGTDRRGMNFDFGPDPIHQRMFVRLSTPASSRRHSRSRTRWNSSPRSTIRSYWSS